MRSNTLRRSGAALGALALVAACASSDPAPTRPPEPRAASAESTAAPAGTVAAADVDADVWGAPPTAEAAALRAFLAEGTGAAPDAVTIPVSFSEGTDGEPAAARHMVTALRLRNGKLLAGRLVSDDGATVEFAFETEDGVRGTTRVAYADIHPESVAELMLARADEGDSGALMEIAEYAADERLYEVARVHYLAAAQQDEAVAGIAAKRLMDLADAVAASELQRGSAAVTAGNDAAARRILRRVQREFAGTAAADDAAAAIAQIDERAAAKRLDAAREKRLAPIRDLLADADDLTGKGLATAHQPRTAVRSYMAARTKATTARRRIPAARSAAEKDGDDELRGALDDLEARLVEQEIDNETHLATAYLDSGDLTRARQAANAVLALDPQNREALSLLSQIRAAEEERRRDTYDVWWYRYRRYRPVYPYPHRWYPGRGQSWGTIRRGGATTRPPIGVFRR